MLSCIMCNGDMFITVGFLFAAWLLVSLALFFLLLLKGLPDGYLVANKAQGRQCTAHASQHVLLL